MILQRQPGRMRAIYQEFPGQFWVLIGGLFIDHLGGALMFPFFTLYVTQKFGIGMTEVGLVFGLFSVSSIIGSTMGGALSDRLGRKGMLIFGLLTSAFTSLLMMVANSIELFFVAAICVGLFAEAGSPAQQAMVADLLPEEKRAQGFGILRVVVNLAATVGPAVGGLLAARSFAFLFICDAVASTITAAIVALAMRETRPDSHPGQTPQTMGQTFAGYRRVLQDSTYVLFLGASTLMILVYFQLNSTLAVYLRDVHGVSARDFGYILSLNAAVVVLFQFAVTRWIAKYRPLRVMAAGTLLYAVGFAMYGLVSTFVLFLASMLIITMGEMMVSPTSQAVAAQLAPEDMRGRYMAVFGFSWGIPVAVGPLLAGLIMDHIGPRWVWYACGLLGLISAGWFVLLQRRMEWQRPTSVAESPALPSRQQQVGDYPAAPEGWPAAEGEGGL